MKDYADHLRSLIIKNQCAYRKWLIARRLPVWWEPPTTDQCAALRTKEGQ